MKVQLPPIATIAPNMPILQLNINEQFEEEQVSVEEEEQSRSVPFSNDEDLLILKTVMNYFGPTFTGRIPWGFWEVFKRTTGSWRSYSSLYHHWVGSLSRKYRVFLERGMIADCVRYLEASKAIDQSLSTKKKTQPNGAIRSISMPTQQKHVPLARFNSYNGF